MVSEGSAQHGPAGHWSAANPIPTIHKFVENLDKDKKDRDQRIDDELKRRKQNAREQGQSFDQEAADVQEKGTRQVTDPVTGKEIEIEDVQKQYLEESKNPKVSDIHSAGWQSLIKRTVAHCSERKSE
jgi:hypothetical protein